MSYVRSLGFFFLFSFLKKIFQNDYYITRSKFTFTCNTISFRQTERARESWAWLNCKIRLYNIILCRFCAYILTYILWNVYVLTMCIAGRTSVVIAIICVAADYSRTIYRQMRTCESQCLLLTKIARRRRGEKKMKKGNNSREWETIHNYSTTHKRQGILKQTDPIRWKFLFKLVGSKRVHCPIITSFCICTFLFVNLIDSTRWSIHL